MSTPLPPEEYENKTNEIYDLFDEIIDASKVCDAFEDEEEGVIPKAVVEKRLQTILKNVARLQEILETIR